MKSFLSLLCLAGTISTASAATTTAPTTSVPVRTDMRELSARAQRDALSEKSYRQREFAPYYTLEELRKKYKVNNYSAYENPTGIYYRKGDTATITLDAPKGSAGISLIVHDFGPSGTHDVYPLKNGVNTIKIRQSGLSYINYRHANPQQAAPIKVNIQGGQVNGIFTHLDNNKTWQKLIQGTVCEMIDIVGERVHLVYHVEQLRKHTPSKGAELIATYDEIIKQQQDLMGWGTLIAHPGNHIFGRNIWRGFMHADGMGAAFHHNTMGEVGNADRLPKSSWGVAHEFGHVNQVRPGMLWVGTGEITNNIFSAWSGYLLNPSYMRLEHENTPSPNGNLRGGRMHCYIHSALVEKRPWQFQQGPDSFNYGKHGAGKAAPSLKEEIQASSKSYDHFVNVSPLWQLQLYMDVARGKSDFYPQIFQKIRETDESKLTQGQLRANFMKNACDAAQLNLSRFFALTRMLAPVNRWKNDYGSRMLTFTPEMVRDVLEHAHQYPDPDSPVIYYINSNNVKIFKNKTTLKAGSALTPVKGKITVPANQWQGAVAFEVRKGKKLIGVSLLGLGHKDNKTTDIFVPEDVTDVFAVSWNGKRSPIYQKGR